MPETTFYDMDDLGCKMNYRFIQPPQIAYLITTVDGRGNANTTPATLGTCVGASLPRNGRPSEYFYTFSLGAVDIPDPGNKLNPRHGCLNLKQVPECVISYFGYDLMHESWLTALPVPYGISEIEVAGLTLMKSRKVSPPGIAECPVNMEARVIQTVKLGYYYEHFICQIVGVSVSSRLAKMDEERGDGLGIFHTDPLFEVRIIRGETGNLRLYYGRMDPEKIHRTSDEVGCITDWIGDFEKWIDDEQKRGKITTEQRDEIIELNTRWQQDRDPNQNQDVKEQLTRRLRTLVLA